MYVTELQRAIFAVYNGKDGIEYVEVNRNDSLIEEMVSKGKLFFLNFILPELLAKRFSSVKNVPSSDLGQFTVPFHSENLNQIICDCQDVNKKGETVMCSSKLCVIHEFHKSCTRSKRFEDWICRYCKKEIADEKRRAANAKRKKALALSLLTQDNAAVADIDVIDELPPISDSPANSEDSIDVSTTVLRRRGKSSVLTDGN